MPALASRRRTQAMAWAASLTFHTLVSASIVWVAGSSGGGEQEDAPFREVGIVLRTEQLEPAPFEEQAAEPAEVEPAEAEPDSSPSEVSPSPFSTLLDELTAEGPPPGEPNEAFTGEANESSSKGAAWTDLPIGQTRVRVFGVEGVGSRFVYAFDRSISMRGPPLREAKAQLIGSLDALESTHQFQTIFFNTNVAAYDLTGGQRRLAFATDPNKRRAVSFVEGVSADGGTDRYQALLRAFGYRPDVVFFLTDSDGGMDPANFAHVVDLATRRGVVVHAIEFGQGPSRGLANFLVRLAEATGGQYDYVDTKRLSR